MNQKELIKWGVIALGAYLVYRYIQDHGGIEGLLGTGTGVAPGITPSPRAFVSESTNPSETPTHTNTIQPVQILDMTGLVVTPDINDSLSGTVKVKGIPIRLSIITADGRIFDSSGSEVGPALQAQGVDIAALRNGFIQAASGLSGLGTAPRWTPAWLM